jgi:hypothetical protein
MKNEKITWRGDAQIVRSCSCQSSLSSKEAGGCLSLAEVNHAVVAAPRGLVRRAELVGLVALVAQTAALAARRRQAALLTVAVDRVDDPVDARVVADCLVHRVHGDDLVPLEGRVLVHPVRVEHAHVAELLAKALLRDGAVVLAELATRHASSAGLAVRDALVSGALAATAANPHAEDRVAVLRLVAQRAGLLRACGPAATHDGVLVAELPRPHALDEAHDVGRLLLPQLVQVHEGAHGFTKGLRK